MDLIRWWLTLEFFGLAGLPILAFLFPGLRDRGISLARIIGLVVVAYPVWLVSHWGEVFGTPVIVTVFLLWGLVSFVIFLIDLPNWKSAFAHPGELILSELVFHAAFLGLALIRAYNPEIEGMWKGGGSEKFMDLNFVNSILSSTQFPPRDNWLAGFPINYYYYGYYLTAVLVKLTGVLPHVGYNLMVVSVYALAIQGLWGLLRNMGCKWYTSLLGVFLMFFAANLKAAGLSIEKDANMLPWRASRVIDLQTDHTINEFPWFSFLWGDLHGHLSGMPLQLAILGLSWGAVASYRLVKTGKQIFIALLLSLTFGSLVMSNAWDLPAFAAILVFSILAGASIRQDVGGWKKTGLLLILRVVAVAAVFLVFFHPFIAQFVPPTSGYNRVPWQMKTPIGLLLLVFGSALGVLLLPFAKVAAELFLGPFRSKEQPTGEGESRTLTAALVLSAAVGLVVTWILRSEAGSAPSGLTPGFLSILVLLALAWLLINWWEKGNEGSESEIAATRFAGFLAILGFGLVLTCEFVAIKDFYGEGANLRLNTVFKFHLQAWLLLSIVAAFATDRFIGEMRLLAASGTPGRKQLAWAGMAAQVVVVLIAVGYAGVGSWKVLVVKCSNFESTPTLDGLAYALPREGKNARPVGERDMSTDDARAIMDLLDLQRFTPDPKQIVLEAPGNPYSINGRVASFSGIPTVLAVANHERIWNKEKKEVMGQLDRREKDADTIYRTSNFKKSKELLDSYGVTHVFWGTVEARKYGAAARRKFDQYMKPLKSFGATTIFSGYLDVPIKETNIEEVAPKPLVGVKPIGDPAHPLEQPRGVTLGPDGGFYVCNSKKGVIDCYSAEGAWVRSYGSPGAAAEAGGLATDYSGVDGVAVAEDGTLYAADTWHHRIAVFAPEGTYQREIKSDFFGPRNLVLFNGQLVVADTGKHRLVVVTPGGHTVRTVGNEGRGSGEFVEPVGLAVSNNQLYVADVGNGRVQAFGTDYQPRFEFPVLGWEDQVGTEAYLAVDGKGAIWLTDSGKSRIEKFSADGNLLAIYGPACPPAGSLRNAKGLAWRNGKLLVSDFGNNRLLVYAAE
jgi:YYY domain-containing protein